MEASVSQGKRDKHGEIMPLSGLMYCADCGDKMRLGWNNTTAGSKKKPRKSAFFFQPVSPVPVSTLGNNDPVSNKRIKDIS